MTLGRTVSMKVCTWQAGHGGKPTGSSGTMQASRSAWQPEKEPLARTVQTPVLALVSRRYLENRDFNAVPYYRLELSVLKDGKELVFTCPEKYTQQQEAVAARNRIAASRVATVIQAERKETVEEPPLLHDLASLAEGANLRMGLT